MNPFDLSVKRLENGVEETDSVASDDSALSRPVREKQWPARVLLSLAKALLFLNNNISEETVYRLCGRKDGRSGVHMAVENIKRDLIVNVGPSSLYAFMRCMVFMSKLAFVGTPEGKKKNFQPPEIENSIEYTLSVVWGKWKDSIKKRYRSENGGNVSNTDVHSDAYVGIYTLVYNIMEVFNMQEEDERLV